jgi:hypothetical protein
MIHEEICTYEVCKLAEEKGFNVPTRTVKVEKIECTEKEVWDEEECRYITQWETRSLRIPTQSLLQRWLREEKNLYISIIAHAKSKSVYYEWEVRYISALGNMNKASSVMTIETYCYNTYELALEDALKYSLENLI